ncbi:GNAT family N-acetyltransferase [Adlercreutzia sp. R25]|uniref:GNAT family N-acetyltransferase n=1 Tax=Adlercreutzia shanghongiae TaxID=3111773 RepID=A0ABU6IWC5_9ACTN|nr:MULTISPECIES: GNAT family N-acetyltransferase [unclassified Adlercreutzia]MEC4273805.1 GNAT family N-acetyltransferase [Adlercreutzia sp. R25]MEC4294139.1 GNAT family N-acetyltransferase [Adlercreutzia sp. R22]
MSALEGLTMRVTRPYREEDVPAMTEIWNAVVEAGRAFPQENTMTVEEARVFFAEQSHAAVATVNGRVAGLYILHPNNVGRCGHVSNASYAVSSEVRGHGLGRLLVEDSLRQAARLGFRGLQFNAVVTSNERAIALYENLGFRLVGTVPGGFRNKDGVYEDTRIYYRETA